MRQKKISILISVVVLTIFGANSSLWAQKAHVEKVQHKTERMAKRLDLNQEQKEKVYAINLKKFEAYKELKDSKENYSKKERRQKFKSKISTWKNELKSVLNEEQLKIMKIM